jgi:uncharacterized coiled-coil protein SlyX
MKVDKLAARLATLKRKLAKTQTQLRLLCDEIARTSDRYDLAVAGSKIEARKRG